MKARNVLLAVGLSYGIWETVDIFRIDVPAVAAVFAALFFACTAWFWRRNSLSAATALLALCAFEAGVAPTLHAETVTKAFDVALGLTGVVAAVVVLVHGRRIAVPPLRQQEGELS